MAQVNLEAVVKLKDEASAGLKALGGSFKQAGDMADKVLKTAAVGATAAIAGLTAVAIKGLNEYRAQEDAEMRLSAAIQNVTGTVDKNITSLLKQADALQFTTRFADEQIISGQAMLTTFGLTQQQIEKLTPSMLDLAERMRSVDGGTISLESASSILGKAVAGNLGLLGRYGIILSDNQQKQLESLSTQERAIAVADLLQSKFGGLAESAGNSLSGQLDILNHVLSEIWESIGYGIAQRLQPLTQEIIDNKDQIIEFGLKAADAMDKLIAKLIEIGTWFYNVGKAITEWVNANQGLVKALLEFIAYLGIAAVAIALIIKVAAVVAAVVTFLTVPFNLVVVAIVAVVAAIIWMMNHWDLVKKKVSEFGQVMLDIARVVFKPWIDNFNLLASVIKTVMGYLQNNVFSKIGNFATQLGFRAEGGPVSSGKPYIVGERGPELFMPSSSGTIVPNDQLGGANITITMGEVNMRSEQDIRQLAILLGQQIGLASKGAY